MTTQVEAAQGIEYIPVDQVDVHRLNPRRDPGDLTELTESIRQQGVLIPILVVRDNGGYAAVHGSRRLAGAKLAGLKVIPAIVRETMDDDEIAEISLVENLQREDLNALEVAEGYKTYLATVKGSSVNSLAERLGKPLSTVRNTLRLLKAPEHIKRELKNGNLTAAHVKAILGLADPSLIDKLDIWEMSVEQLQEDIAALNIEFRLEGPEATTAAKKFLEESQAKYPNAVITWYERGGQVDMEKLLGKQPKKIVDSESVRSAEKTHDKLCTCRAYAVAADTGRAARGRGSIDTIAFNLERVCIDANGAKKVQAARYGSATKMTGIGSALKPKKITPAQREKQRIQREKQRADAANRALEGKQRYGGYDSTKVDPKLLNGKLDGELARLALFALSSKFSSEFVDGWRAQLWRRIAKLKIADVRARTAAWMARAAMDEIGSRKAEEQELKELVLGHYGIAIKAPAKAKKRGSSANR